ncbi:MAG: NAD(P)/FAD-dependent oxidoreductase [Burkholderiaceae bacterium]|jgi:2,4-dienoyl-CoA reductase-like NADH-dependent reductase (Old Yellow Enzyme family)/thioredoxin reductase|nr:NAD(P)/FAD-dependent oxidoreductase [Burkholderiaceae bacterium]
MEVNSRIVRSPCCTGLGGMDGTVTDRLLRHYKELARGGPGLLIVEYSYIDKLASKSAMCQLGCADTEHIPGLAWLARTIQSHGVKAGIQLEHAGRQKFLGTPPIKAPSRIPWEELHAMGGSPPDELTWDEIQQIVEAFGDAAQRAKLAGFDFIEIHGAHGYLITNFLSPRTNRRTDWYGGSLENRMRFLMQVVANVRAKIGAGFPLGVRLSGTEYEPDGTTIEETVVVAKALEKAGIDVIHVSGGNHHTMQHQVTPLYLPVAHNVWAAEAVKRAVSIPVIASGSLNTPALAEQVLAEGKGDFVGLGRVMFADPYFPAKAAAGLPDEIVPCIRCNDGCQERSFKRYQAVLCTVNPLLGNEGMVATGPAPKRLNVAVVGGGPGGMQAAQTLAKRGHRVTLYERRALGGQMIEGAVPVFKSDLRLLIVNMQSRLKTLGVRVEQREVSPKDLAGGGFDHVIVAIGGAPAPRRFPGSDHAKVADGCAVLRGEEKIGPRVVVVGGGLVGCEVALHLAQQDHQVTIVTRRDDFMGEGSDTGIAVEHSNRSALLELIARHHVQVRTGLQIVEADDEGVQLSDRSGRTVRIAADSVVLSSGFAPQPGFAEELARLGIAASAVGDCVQPRKIFDAIHEAFAAAMRIGDAALDTAELPFPATASSH